MSKTFAPLWSLLNWSLKFPGWPSSAPFTRLSTCCFFSLWWVQVKKNSHPSSPTLLLLAQNRMIKAGVSHQRKLQQCYCTFKGGDGTLWDDSRVLIWKCCLLSGWDQRRPGRCVRTQCCSEWSDQRGGGKGVMVDRLTGICVCASFAVKKFSILHLEKSAVYSNCQDFFVCILTLMVL